MYLIFTPSLIFRMIDSHRNNRRRQNNQHNNWSQIPPRDLPIEARFDSGHFVDIIGEFFVTVHVDDGYHLHHSDNNQTDSTCEGVEEAQPILTRSGGKDQTNEKADQTHGSWNKIRCEVFVNKTLRSLECCVVLLRTFLRGQNTGVTNCRDV